MLVREHQAERTVNQLLTVDNRLVTLSDESRTALLKARQAEKDTCSALENWALMSPPQNTFQCFDCRLPRSEGTWPISADRPTMWN
jgi:hypothetical protein